jgi:hypothetical protein
MKALKICQTKTPKIVFHSNKLISLIMAHYFIFILCLQSKAELPDLAKIKEIEGFGTVILKDSKNRLEAHEDSQLSRRDSLQIPGHNSSLAHLKFFTKNQPSKFLVQVGRHQKPSEYSFPCVVNGGKTTLGFGLIKDGNLGNCRSIKVRNNNIHQVTQLRYPHRSYTLQASTKIFESQVPSDLEQYYCGTVPKSRAGQGKFSVGLSSEDACQKATQRCQASLGTLIATESSVSSPRTSYSAQGGGEINPQTPQPLWGEGEDKGSSNVVSQPDPNAQCVVENLGDWRVSEPELTVSMLCQNQRSDDPSSRYSVDSVTATGSTVETQLLSLEQKYSGALLANCEPVVYTRDEVVLSPLKDNTLVQTNDEQGNIIIDVLVGAINLMSVDFPNGKYIEKGFRYKQGDNKVQLIEDCTKIRKSDDIKIFLKSENWLYGSDYSRGGVSDQLEAYKSNFCESSVKVKTKSNGPSFYLNIPIFVSPPYSDY